MLSLAVSRRDGSGYIAFSQMIEFGLNKGGVVELST